MQLFVTRHGQTAWNLQNKAMGRYDEPLNDKGLQQAQETRDKLLDKNIDLIICSPLKRARQTAEIINRERNIPIIYDDRIVERDFGEFEGKSVKDFDWDYYKNIQYERTEAMQDFFKRVYGFLDDITVKYKDKNILIVAHGGVGIPIACYFNKNIPFGSLIDSKLLLKNCDVATYVF